MSTTRIAVLVGSLRAESVNRQVAEYLRDHAPADVELTVVDGLGEVPFYNEDIDDPAHPDQAPEAARRLRSAVDAADRLLFVTPEYNGTMPAVLNNAIDWISRPYGAGVIVAKPYAVIGVTPTPYGGVWAHEHTLKSATVAGGLPVPDSTLSQSSIELDLFADDDVLGKFRHVVDSLVDFDATAAVAA